MTCSVAALTKTNVNRRDRVGPRLTSVRTRKLRAYVHEVFAGCIGHLIVGVAAAILGLGANHFGLSRLAIFFAVVAIVVAVSALRPQRMSDRYTPNARRVIFFARDEAMRRGNHYIDTEHLLLGVLRENANFPDRLGWTRDALAEFRRGIESITTVGQPVVGTVEMSLSPDSKQILRFAAEEAELLGHRDICLGHLLLGMLKVGQSNAARILQLGGANVSSLREKATENMLWAEEKD